MYFSLYTLIYMHFFIHTFIYILKYAFTLLHHNICQKLYIYVQLMGFPTLGAKQPLVSAIYAPRPLEVLKVDRRCLP